MDIKGRDLVSGIPKTIPLSEEEVREALSEPVSSIMETVKVALENTPPELAATRASSTISSVLRKLAPITSVL